MAGIHIKNLKSPDETRPFADKGKLDVVKVGDTTVGYGRFEPGWRWSQHVKPLAGTDTCEASHTGYCLSGRLHIKMDDGEEKEVGPGDAFHVEPGHDAWVVGKEACVMLDFTGFEDYARPGKGKRPGIEHPAVH